MRLMRFLLFLLVVGVTNQAECSTPLRSLSSFFYWAQRYGYRTEILTFAANAFRIPVKIGYQHILILGDRHGTWHAGEMYRQLIEVKGVPEKNVVQIEEFTRFVAGPSLGLIGNAGVDWLLSSSGSTLTDMLSRTFVDLRSQVRVVGIPYFLGVFGNLPHQIPLVDASNLLFVIPALNTRQVRESAGVKESDPRDFWYSDHPFWEEFSHLDHTYYMDLFRTDNVILASSHGFRWDGTDDRRDGKPNLTLTVFPGQHNVKCGEAKNNCFSLAVSDHPQSSYSDYTRYHSGSYTSAATVHLSAIAFYLAQFFPTAEEIVSTLRACAIDVGAPGPDEEYGVGVVNIFCPEVFEKEAEMFAGSLRSSGKSSPVLQELTHRSSDEGFSFRTAVGLGFQGVQGHVGMSYATPSFHATFLTGFGEFPFGVASHLHQQRSTFFEVGLRKLLVPHLFLITTYGRQSGDFSLSSVRAGLHATRDLGRTRASLYFGRHTFSSSFGFPGYQAAGARKVSFSRGAWEARFSLSLSM